MLTLVTKGRASQPTFFSSSEGRAVPRARARSFGETVTMHTSTLEAHEERERSQARKSNLGHGGGRCRTLVRE